MGVQISPRLGMMPTTPAEADELWRQRQAGRDKPFGHTTHAGIWLPTPAEVCACCADLAPLVSPRWGWGYYRHCRTRKHCRALAEKWAALAADRDARQARRLALALRLDFDRSVSREERKQARFGAALGATDFETALALAAAGVPEPAAKLTKRPRSTSFVVGEVVRVRMKALEADMPSLYPATILSLAPEERQACILVDLTALPSRGAPAPAPSTIAPPPLLNLVPPSRVAAPFPSGLGSLTVWVWISELRHLTPRCYTEVNS